MRHPKQKTSWLVPLLAVLVLAVIGFYEAHAQAPKPNILVIFGDDIGQSNINAYSKGLMGYNKPRHNFLTFPLCDHGQDSCGLQAKAP
jgi:hypothetical protein